AVAGSPDTYGEFERLIMAYRASQGLSSKDVSQDIIQAERDVKAAEVALVVGKATKLSSSRIAELTSAVEVARIRYHQLNQAT
ncbi:hypothetical protein LCGC14_2480340, partial [marine sediment metagenome]